MVQVMLEKICDYTHAFLFGFQTSCGGWTIRMDTSWNGEGYAGEERLAADYWTTCIKLSKVPASSNLVKGRYVCVPQLSLFSVAWMIDIFISEIACYLHIWSWRVLKYRPTVILGYFCTVIMSIRRKKIEKLKNCCHDSLYVLRRCREAIPKCC